MGYGLDLTGTDKGDAGGGGNFIDKSGWYHLDLKDFEDKSDQGRLVFKVQALASEVAGKVGATSSIALYLPSSEDTEEYFRKNVMNLISMACALQVYTWDQYEADKANGVSPNFNFHEAIGMQFCCRIWMNKKNFANFGDIAAVGDEDAKECPKNREQLAAYGDSLPTGNTGLLMGANGGGGDAGQETVDVF